MLDELLPGNLYLRTVISKLPGFLQPRPKLHSFVLGIGLDGKVVANLQYAGSDAYAPITSVREHRHWLYFGSLTYPAIGRLPLFQAIPGASPPPPGWDQVPVAREQELPKPDNEEEEEREREEREAMERESGEFEKD